MNAKTPRSNRTSVPMETPHPSRELSEAERLAYDMLLARCIDLIGYAAIRRDWISLDRELHAVAKFEIQHRIIATTSGYRIALIGGES